MLRVKWCGIVVCVCLGAVNSGAQELVPRAYAITPIHWNAVNLNYSFNIGTLLFDGSVPITDATANVSIATVSYSRSLSFFGRTALLTGALPYGRLNARGLAFDVPKSSLFSGLLPAVFRYSVNLHGGPAMNAEQFTHWRQKTIIGISFIFVLPTGQYDPTKLINLGSHRWSFRTELGYSRRIGRWTVDGYGGLWFFTSNPEFFSRNQYPPGTLFENPVGEFDAHLSYDFKPGLWVSLNGNFWSGGRTSLNGVQSPGTLQMASRAGVTSAIPISTAQSIKFVFSRGVYVRYPGNYTSVGAGWQYSWGGNP